MEKIKVGAEQTPMGDCSDWSTQRKDFLNKTAELYRLKKELQKKAIKPGYVEKVEVFLKDRASGDLTRPDAQLKIVARLTVRYLKNIKDNRTKRTQVTNVTKYLEFEVNEEGDLLRRRKVFPAKNMLHNYVAVKEIVAKLLLKLGERSGDAQAASAPVCLMTA